MCIRDREGFINSPNTGIGGETPGIAGGAGSDGAAIRRISGLTVTITNDGTIKGETTATGVS